MATEEQKLHIEVFDAQADDPKSAQETLADYKKTAAALIKRRDQLQRTIDQQNGVIGIIAEDFQSIQTQIAALESGHPGATLNRESVMTSPESAARAANSSNGFEEENSPGEPEKPVTIEDILTQFGANLTQQAADCELDPVVGRQSEIHETFTILVQRGSSNPLYLGEAGIGKTALAEGVAQAIIAGKAPKQLKDAKLFSLDLNAVVAGASAQGQFEERLLMIVNGVSEHNRAVRKGEKEGQIILFIDELHAALNAGGIGNGGAGQILKPALARGDFKVIGSTTQAEYSEHIMKDKALVRRFQPMFIQPPTDEETLEILAGLKKGFEEHHGVKIPDERLSQIVTGASRYLTSLYQPDKSIKLLDNACARANMSGDEEVSEDIVVKALSVASKIDEGFLKRNDGQRYAQVKKELPEAVIGQTEATGAVGMALMRAKAKLNDPNKPLASFMFVGPSGVGKTEVARALAKMLHGSIGALIRTDMSDYQERHEVSKLVGAPPGYVGYGEEGQLTGAVRRKPFSVVLLDEIEKAHPDVQKRFMPVLEEGELVDSRGNPISFRNTIIIMTTNAGAHAASEQAEAKGITQHENPEAWHEITAPIYEQALRQKFLPEFLGRISERIIFNPLCPDAIGTLVDRQLSTVVDRLHEQWGVGFAVDKEAKDALQAAGYSQRYGARHLKSAVERMVVNPLSMWLADNSDELERLNGHAASKVIDIQGIGDGFCAHLADRSANANNIVPGSKHGFSAAADHAVDRLPAPGAPGGMRAPDLSAKATP